MTVPSVHALLLVEQRLSRLADRLAAPPALALLEPPRAWMRTLADPVGQLDRLLPAPAVPAGEEPAYGEDVGPWAVDAPQPRTAPAYGPAPAHGPVPVTPEAPAHRHTAPAAAPGGTPAAAPPAHLGHPAVVAARVLGAPPHPSGEGSPWPSTPSVPRLAAAAVPAGAGAGGVSPVPPSGALGPGEVAPVAPVPIPAVPASVAPGQAWVRAGQAAGSGTRTAGGLAHPPRPPGERLRLASDPDVAAAVLRAHVRPAEHGTALDGPAPGNHPRMIGAEGGPLDGRAPGNHPGNHPRMIGAEGGAPVGPEATGGTAGPVDVDAVLDALTDRFRLELLRTYGTAEA